jgi:hypothetical protein
VTDEYDQLRREQHRSLMRVATFLVRDDAVAAPIVADSFAALRDTGLTGDAALSFVRRAVVTRSRARLRRDQE